MPTKTNQWLVFKCIIDIKNVGCSRVNAVTDGSWWFHNLFRRGSHTEQNLGQEGYEKSETRDPRSHIKNQTIPGDCVISLYPEQRYPRQ